MKAAQVLFRLQVVRALLVREFSAADGPGPCSGGMRLQLRGQALLICASRCDGRSVGGLRHSPMDQECHPPDNPALCYC